MPRLRRQRGRWCNKKSQAKKLEPAWPLEDEIELLGSLDFILWNEERKISKSDTLQHLRDCLQKKYTISQIGKKLYDLCKASGPTEAKNNDEIYILGSAYLVNLDFDIRSEVCSRFAVIKVGVTAMQISTPRKLRSASRTVEPDSVSRIKLEADLFGRSASSKGSQDGSQDLQGFGQSRTIRGNEQRKLVIPTSQRLLADHIDYSDQEREGSPTLTSIADSEECLDIKISFTTEKTSTLDRGADCTTAFGEMLPLSLSESTGSRLLSALDSERLKPRFGSGLDLFDIGDREHTPERLNYQELEENNAFLQEKLRQSEERFQKFTMEQRSASSANYVTETGDLQAACEAIELQRNNIFNLQRQLRSLKDVTKLFNFGPNGHKPLNVEDIQKDLQQIRRRMENLLSEKKFQEPCTTVVMEGLDDLTTLMRRSLGLRIAEQTHFSVCEGAMLGLPLGMIIRSLIAAAICEWVFECDLRPVPVSSDPLLEKYRTQVEILGGPKALKALDLAAHQSLIEEEHFQQLMIPRKASLLADRLVNTLEPFVAQQFPNSGTTPDLGSMEWKAERERLKTVFEFAIKLKTKTILSEDLFEAFWPAPGSAFKESSMEPVMLAMISQGDPLPKRTPEVKVALFPGLRFYRHDKRLVDYCSFTQGLEHPPGKSEQLGMAVVVVK